MNTFSFGLNEFLSNRSDNVNIRGILRVLSYHLVRSKNIFNIYFTIKLFARWKVGKLRIVSVRHWISVLIEQHFDRIRFENVYGLDEIFRKIIVIVAQNWQIVCIEHENLRDTFCIHCVLSWLVCLQLNRLKYQINRW